MGAMFRCDRCGAEITLTLFDVRIKQHRAQKTSAMYNGLRKHTDLCPHCALDLQQWLTQAQPKAGG